MTSPENVVLDLNQKLAPRYEIFQAPSDEGIPFDVWIHYGDFSASFHKFHDYKAE